jgi:hypothetical protein
MDIDNLQAWIDSGSLLDATVLAESWRSSCVEMQDLVKQKLADTRRDIYSVDWVEEMPNLLTAARSRVSRSCRAIAAARDSIQPQLDELEVLYRPQFTCLLPQYEAKFYHLRNLDRALANCYLAHVELHNPLIGARSVWLDEQIRQGCLDFAEA